MFGVELEDDHAGLAGGSHADGHQAAHAALEGFLVGDHGHVEPVGGFGELHRLACVGHRVEVVGGTVAKVAGAVDALHDAGHALDDGRERFGVIVFAGESNDDLAVVFVVLVVFGDVDVVAVVAEHHALGHRGKVVHVAVFGRDGELLAVAGLHGRRDLGAGVAPDVTVEVLGLAKAHEQSTSFSSSDQREDLALLALEVAIAERVGDLRLERGRHASEAGVGDVVALREGQNEGAVKRVARADFDAHVDSRSWTEGWHFNPRSHLRRGLRGRSGAQPRWPRAGRPPAAVPWRLAWIHRPLRRIHRRLPPGRFRSPMLRRR